MMTGTRSDVFFFDDPAKDPDHILHPRKLPKNPMMRAVIGKRTEILAAIAAVRKGEEYQIACASGQNAHAALKLINDIMDQYGIEGGAVLYSPGPGMSGVKVSPGQFPRRQERRALEAEQRREEKRLRLATRTPKPKSGLAAKILQRQSEIDAALRESLR